MKCVVCGRETGEDYHLCPECHGEAINDNAREMRQEEAEEEGGR